MRYYPVFLDIQGRRCLVVGGGSVGTRKVNILLQCGADVTVVSLEATQAMQALCRKGSIELKLRAYQSEDLVGMFLVIGATNNEALNSRISADAQARNILCNIVDRPGSSNFIVPSIVHRGDLVLAISTSGRSPAFAKKLRQEFEAQFGWEYADFLHLMGAIRKKLLSTAHEPEAHRHLFDRLIAEELLEKIRNRQKAEINRLLAEILGPGYQFDELMNTELQV